MNSGLTAIKQPDLIYDLGFHVGQDTEFYLKKGFRVIAVEANPSLCDKARDHFAEYLLDDRLIIVNRAVATELSQATFYDNVNSAWGTIDPMWAARNQRLGSPSTQYVVDTITMSSLLAEFGVPYYLKIDIEGMDMVALQGLLETDQRPSYVSIESDKTSFRQLRQEFSTFQELGYDRFKVVSQRTVSRQVLPNPALEGNYIHHSFVFSSSGAFGEEVPGTWLTAEEAIDRYRSIFLQYALTGDDPYIRSRTIQLLLKALGLRNNWYDTHAKHSSIR